jgi:hypothetical protein
MTKTRDPVSAFRERLYAEWLPVFCNDPRRGYGTDGFRDDYIRVTPRDAANFLRAIDGGLVRHVSAGQYQCARSKALEQLFWQHEKHKVPRPVTLWMEPVITMATLARMHYDLGWPEHHLGMQTADWAFDLAAYSDGESPRLLIACEVKKSRLEIDHLVSDLMHHSCKKPGSAISERPRHINSFKKWESMRREGVPLLWVVGPDGYEFAFALSHQPHTIEMTAVDVDRLRYEQVIATA